MRAIIGDIIGTTDGRYGTVTGVTGNVLAVAEAADASKTCSDEVNYFVITQSEVASIV